jgi:hypothetical protein
MKHQTLTCQGPPPHEWEREGGRGRPPKFCPKHTPKKEASNNGNGSKPTVERATEIRSNPFIEKALRQKREAEAATSASGLPVRERATGPAHRVDKPEPESTDREEELYEESERLDKLVESTMARYEAAFNAANKYRGGDKHESDRLWNLADKAQSTAINVLARQRLVNQKLERITEPTAV